MGMTGTVLLLIILSYAAVVIAVFYYIRMRCCSRCGKLAVRSTENTRLHRGLSYEVRCRHCGFTKWRKLLGSGGGGYGGNGGGGFGDDGGDFDVDSD